MRRTFARAVPDTRTLVIGSMLWALSMGAVAAGELIWMQWFAADRIAYITLFFVIGGLLAFAPGIFVGRLLSRGRRDAGLAATFLALATATVGLTAFLVGLQYRHYYAAWHEAPFTIVWIFQFIFTIGAAVYQFLVLGARIYFPFGLALLFVASLWNVRHMR